MTIFDDSANPEETLIGEGKKYADTPTALKALVHSQEHIARLEEENRQLRVQEQNRQTFEELLNEQRAPTLAPLAKEENTPVQSPDDLARLVRELTQQEREAERIRANVDTVANQLINTYGSEDKANEVVRQKAAELGVSVQFLQDVAAKSPKAFFAQVGLTQPGSGTPAPAGNEVRVNPTAGPAEGTYAYFQKLRRENPKLYNSRETRNQMMEAARKHGPGWTATS